MQQSELTLRLDAVPTGSLPDSGCGFGRSVQD